MDTEITSTKVKITLIKLNILKLNSKLRNLKLVMTRALIYILTYNCILTN